MSLLLVVWSLLGQLWLRRQHRLYTDPKALRCWMLQHCSQPDLGFIKSFYIFIFSLVFLVPHSNHILLALQWFSFSSKHLVICIGATTVSLSPCPKLKHHSYFQWLTVMYQVHLLLGLYKLGKPSLATMPESVTRWPPQWKTGLKEKKKSCRSLHAPCASGNAACLCSYTEEHWGKNLHTHTFRCEKHSLSLFSEAGEVPSKLSWYVFFFFIEVGQTKPGGLLIHSICVIATLWLHRKKTVRVRFANTAAQQPNHTRFGGTHTHSFALG